MDWERGPELPKKEALVGLAAGLTIVLLLVAGTFISRWTGREADLTDGAKLLESPDRKRRLLGLAKLKGQARALPILARLLDDDDHQVRLVAALMLAEAAGLEIPESVGERVRAKEHAGPDGVADAKAAEFVASLKRWWDSEGRSKNAPE